MLRQGRFEVRKVTCAPTCRLPKENSARRPDVRARGGHDGKAAPSRRTGISSGSDIRKNNCHTDQEPDESTRPGARLFAGCCLCVRFAIRDDPNEAATRAPTWWLSSPTHRRTRPRQYRCARRQTGNGGKGLSVQEIC